MIQKVTLQLEQCEALVLFEILSRELEQDDFGKFKCFSSSAAEIAVFNRLLGALETVLAEPFSRDYDEILARTYADLVERYGDLTSKWK